MLPPWFFHFLKPIPMASNQRKLAAPEAEQAPELVKLHSKDLGVTRDFTPEHAKALLALQEAKGYTHWQPVAADAPTE